MSWRYARERFWVLEVALVISQGIRSLDDVSTCLWPAGLTVLLWHMPLSSIAIFSASNGVKPKACMSTNDVPVVYDNIINRMYSCKEFQYIGRLSTVRLRILFHAETTESIERVMPYWQRDHVLTCRVNSCLFCPPILASPFALTSCRAMPQPGRRLHRRRQPPQQTRRRRNPLRPRTSTRAPSSDPVANSAASPSAFASAPSVPGRGSPSCWACNTSTPR